MTPTASHILESHLEDVDMKESTSRQAEPLPRKRGEFGFQEGVHDVQVGGASSSTLNLPERHPDERSVSLSAGTGASGAIPTLAPAATPAAAADASSTHTAGKQSILSRLSGKNMPRVLGITSITFARFILQMLLLVGTIAGWALVVVQINKSKSPSGQDSNSQPNNIFSGSAPIFVHVAFGIAFLAEALLLERCIFLMRAERYMFMNPGEILPTSLRREMLTTGTARRNEVLALAPWNRPPVPTYAAALAESGVRGTGDVEDGMISQVPPPAYGKTRGSVMVLAGFMSDTHRNQARLARSASTASGISQASDRPVSYMSHDSQWEERRDVRRTILLEETLARLEEGEPKTHSRSSSQDSTRTVMPIPPPVTQCMYLLCCRCRLHCSLMSQCRLHERTVYPVLPTCSLAHAPNSISVAESAICLLTEVQCNQY
jgi:hypothetical protein